MATEKKIYEVGCVLSAYVPVYIRASSKEAARAYVELNYDEERLSRMPFNPPELDAITLDNVVARSDETIQVHGEAD